MGRPLRAVYANSTYSTGVREMSDSDINNLCSELILTQALTSDGLETVVRVNPGAGNWLNIGTAYDIINDTVGTHPSSNTVVSTYNFYQSELAQSLSLLARPVHYVNVGGVHQIKEMSDSDLINYFIPAVVQTSITGGRGAYYLSLTSSPPGTGTWVSRATLADTYYNAGGTYISDSYTLWQRTTGASLGTVRPLKRSVVGGETRLVEMSNAEISDLYKVIGEYVRTVGIGRYALQSSAPVSGTWINRGTFNDTVNDLTDTAYTGYYTSTFTGFYGSSFTGFYSGSYSSTYAGSYSGTYTGLPYAATYAGNYSGTSYASNSVAYFTGPSYASSSSATFTGPSYSSMFVGYFTGPPYASSSTVYYTGPAYNAFYANFRNGPVYAGSYTGYYTGPSYAATYTGYFSDPTGYVGYYLSGRFIMGEPEEFMGIGYNVYITTSSGPSYAGTYAGTYMGPGFSEFFLGTYVGPSYSSSRPAYFTGPAYASFRPVYFTGPAYASSRTQYFVGPSYSSQRTEYYSGPSYAASYTGYYSGPTYTGSFTGSYAGSRTYFFTGSYTGFYGIPYTGFYSNSFTGYYSGLTVQPTTTVTTYTLWVRTA